MRTPSKRLFRNRVSIPHIDRRVSFNNFVGARCQPGRHIETKCLRSLQVDHELELGWLDDGQIGRLLALKNPTGVEGGLTIGIREARAIASQAAGSGKLTSFIDRRNGMARCQRNDLIALAAEER